MPVTRRRLPKLYRKFAFTVRGSGRFPFDMLRYDGCYPETGMDVTSMTSEDREVFGRSQERNVRLRSDREPTVDRWTSFGWQVVNCEGVA